MKSPVSIAAVIVAFVGIAIAVFQEDLRSDPPTRDVPVKQRVLERGAEWVGIKVEKPGPQRDAVRLAYMGLGLLALAGAVTGFLRRENHHAAGMAGALAVVAIAWEYVLIAIVIAVVIYLLSYVDLGG